MKTDFRMTSAKRVLSIIIIAALFCMPAMAQRRGGDGPCRSTSQSGSNSSARSTSISRSSSSSSAPSRSTVSSSSPSSSNRSGNTAFRSSAPNSNNRSFNNSRSNNNSNRYTKRNNRRTDYGRNNTIRNRSDINETSRGNAIGRNDNASRARFSNDNGRRNITGTGNNRHKDNPGINNVPGGRSTGNLSGGYRDYRVSSSYAKPGSSHNPLPPSYRPIHPAPYFYHPYHHTVIHMRPIIWEPVHFVPVYWPGFWTYCNTYWYDYHVTNTIVVRNYVRDNYNVNLVCYCLSGNLMYAIIDDIDGNTYLKVFDDRDNLLAEQPISRRYCKMEIDRENGGCWIFKKRNNDPMLFLYIDGELLIYEAD